MDWADLLAFNLVLAAALISPGPALLFALRTALTDGQAAGFSAGLGLGLTAALWTLAALMGLDSLFRIFPWTYSIIKLVGAGYLLCLAWRMWRDADQPLPNVARPRGRAFMDGVLVNLANPKSVLFAAAVLVVVFPKGLSIAEITLIVANHMVLEWIFYALFTGFLGRAGARRAYLSAKPMLDRFAGGLMGVLGLRLGLDR